MLSLCYLQTALNREDRRVREDWVRGGHWEWGKRTGNLGMMWHINEQSRRGIIVETHRGLLETLRFTKLRGAVVACVCGYNRGESVWRFTQLSALSNSSQQAEYVCVCVSVLVYGCLGLQWCLCVHVLVTTKRLEIYWGDWPCWRTYSPPLLHSAPSLRPESSVCFQTFSQPL